MKGSDRNTATDNGERFGIEVRNVFPLKPLETWPGIRLFELASGLESSRLPCWVFSVHLPGCAVLRAQERTKYSHIL